MTPEQRMMKSLVSKSSDSEKLASKSVGDLELLFKEANGDMLQYFQDHPEKLKEKQKRDAAKEKKAYEIKPSDRTSIPKKEFAQPNKEEAGHKGKYPIPDAQHYRSALGFAKMHGDAKAEAAIRAKGRTMGYEKKAGAEGIKFAENLARDLAKQASFGVKIPNAVTDRAVAQVAKATRNESVKDALKSGGKGLASGLVASGIAKLLLRKKTTSEPKKKEAAGAGFDQAAASVMKNAPKAAKAVGDALKGVGKRLTDIKNPIHRSSAIGGTLGGVGGAAQGFFDPKEDSAGQKHRLRTAFRKGLGGAASGMTTGALAGTLSKTSSTKTAGPLPGIGAIGGMAKNFLQKAAPAAQQAMSAAKPTLMRGAAALGRATPGQAALGGSAVGGALGAAKGFVAPGKDAQGNTKSRIGGAMKGAVSGAAGGAALGVAGGGLVQNRKQIAGAINKFKTQ